MIASRHTPRGPAPPSPATNVPRSDVRGQARL